MKLPKLMTMIEAGKRKVRAVMYTDIWYGIAAFVWLSDCMSGTKMITMGTMKIVINSWRVNALKSFLSNAASTVENPSLPKKPVLGA